MAHAASKAASTAVESAAKEVLPHQAPKPILHEYALRSRDAVGSQATNQIYRLKLSTELALKEAKILDASGKITREAQKKSFPAMNPKKIISNPDVVKERTKDGSAIKYWKKEKNSNNHFAIRPTYTNTLL